MIYLRARYYNPADGRLQSRDTWGGNISLPMSYNSWLYTYGNPVNYTDPTGLITEKESADADKIVNELKKYNVFIKVDWGYQYRDSLPAPCGWAEGLWSLDDLDAVKVGVHIIDAGIHSLGGDFKSLVHQAPIRRETGARSTTRGGTIRYMVDNSSRFWKLHSLIHEIGHVVSGSNSPQLINYFMSELGSSCVSQKPYCHSELDPQDKYDAGSYAGANNEFMPSPYALKGSSEDFAESFREVVTSAYFHSGDNTYLADARIVYNNTSLGFNHNIGMRRVVMQNIIDGSWKK